MKNPAWPPFRLIEYLSVSARILYVVVAAMTPVLKLMAGPLEAVGPATNVLAGSIRKV